MTNMTEVMTRLLTEIDLAMQLSESDPDDYHPMSQEAFAYAKSLIQHLPEDFLIALDLEGECIYPMSHGTLMIDLYIDLNNQICIEIGKTSSSCHAWINGADIQSVENSVHGDLAWLSFLQESFDKIRDTMTTTANMTKADPAS